MSQVSGLALDLQDGISHPAAKPECMSQVSGLALDLQHGIPHPAAKPEPLVQNCLGESCLGWLASWFFVAVEFSQYLFNTLIIPEFSHVLRVCQSTRFHSIDVERPV